MERVALITGIRRVGREIALRLLEKGYSLSIVYRSSEEVALEIEERGKELGREVLVLKSDLSEEECERVVEETFSRFGRIDALIHLASPYRKTSLGSLSLEELREHMVPITEAFLFLSKHSARKMLENEGAVKGHIVAFGDWAVEHTPYRDYVAYFVAKGALHTAVKVLAKELAPHVLVNCIALGPTLRAEGLSQKQWEGILKRTPLGREVSLSDVISLTEFLLEADSITGEVIKLDGGRHLAGSGTGSVG